MILSDHFQIKRLWRGNKGRLPHELELPPLSWDGAGFPFAVAQDNKTLCLCNQTYLLEWVLSPRQATIDKVIRPLVEADLWGITSCSEGWVVVAHKSEEMMAVYLDHRLRTLRTVLLEGFLKDYNLSPPLRVRWDPKDRIHLADDEQGITVNSLGQTVSRWQCPYGFTTRADGTLLIPKPEQTPLANKMPTLLGIDRRGLYYWQVDTPRDHPLQPYIETSLVICDSRGTIERQFALNGDLGAIRELRAASQVDWIEVANTGQIYVLGWTHKGLRGVVGLWRLSA
ncbi:MAG: hypothetical protein KatS3mg019_1975 [Fimbriimonadales bacterium]|nr:MAG: hypothetical protein KatS3mg019_1975 [Fimbriimonadales bacterium]